MANILITGAAGFIGSHTADHLLAGGHRVWGIDNFRTGRRENIAAAVRSGLRFDELDVLDDGRVARLVQRGRIDVIIHLAALVSVTESIEKPVENFRLNLEATQRIAEVARTQGVRRLVFASSAAVYGGVARVPVAESARTGAISPYGMAKLASEHLLLSYAQTYGLTVRIQRYFNVFGPRQDPGSPYSGVISIFQRRFQRGEPVTIHGDGRQTRDFIYVADVARANGLAATRPGVATGVANICTGRRSSLRQLVAVLARLHPQSTAPMYAAARAGDIRHSAGTTATARRALGFSARCSLAEGLRAMTDGVA